MNALVARVLTHWRTSIGGLLAVAGVVFSALNLSYPGTKWVMTATAIVAGLTGLLAKDN